MTDPRMTDPNEFRRPEPNRVDPRIPSGESNAMWGWIVGAALVAAALVLVFGYGMNTDTTATSTSSPPASTTGAGGSTPPARPAPAPRPAQ